VTKELITKKKLLIKIKIINNYRKNRLQNLKVLEEICQEEVKKIRRKRLQFLN
jgi:hypothetical protein